MHFNGESFGFASPAEELFGSATLIFTLLAYLLWWPFITLLKNRAPHAWTELGQPTLFRPFPSNATRSPSSFMYRREYRDLGDRWVRLNGDIILLWLVCAMACGLVWAALGASRPNVGFNVAPSGASAPSTNPFGNVARRDLYVFALGGVGISILCAYLMMCGLLIRHLRTQQHSLWQQLGSPSFPSQRIGEGGPFLRFIFRREYRSVADPTLQRIATSVLWFGCAFGVFLALWIFAILYSMSNSN